MILNILSPSRPRFGPVLAAALVAPGLLAAGILFPHAASYLSRPHGARMFPDQALVKTQVVARRIGGSCEILTSPHYIETELPGGNSTKVRHTWQSLVSCGDRNVFILINDYTGAVIELVDVGPAQKSDQTDRLSAPVTTEEEAAEVALHYVTDAGIVPPDSEVSLVPQADRECDDSDWRITWKVRASPQSASYTVKAVVRQHDGCIMDTLDTRQLNLIP